MQAYKVGEPFPLTNPHVGNDYVVAAVVAQSFDVICWGAGINSKEVQAWRRGMLRYGTFIKDDIPFFLLYFPEIKWPLDVSINILVEKEHGRPFQDYLSGSGNVVNLFLVDAAVSNTLKATRMIGLNNNVTGAIRLACINQLQTYQTSDEVKICLDAIVSTISTQDMIKMTEMRELSAR